MAEWTGNLLLSEETIITSPPSGVLASTKYELNETGNRSGYGNW